MTRCVDPALGVKVLSYDLLDGDEKAEVDGHLRACSACRDLVEQTFGNTGALRELDWRAFRLSQRQEVPWHAWVARRLRDLWFPFLLALVGLVILLVTLERRTPPPEQVQLVRLAALRAATLDSAATDPVPRIAAAPTALVLEPDRDAIALVYESGAGTLRRLVPGSGGAIPELRGGATQELPLPNVTGRGAVVLLVLAPAAAPRTTDAWDSAVLEQVGPRRSDRSAAGWPGNVTPTLRWLR